MADDPQQPQDPESNGGAADPGDAAGPTRRIGPPGDRDTHPAGGAGATDPTAPRPLPGGDETRPLPGGDETRRPPGVEPTAPVPSRPAAWSGRAGVPSRESGAVRDPVPNEWSYDDDQDNRRWWMPILLGVIALVLLAVLGFAAWLIAESRDRRTPPPQPPVITSAPVATVEPTSAAPTTDRPTPGATTASLVRVPPLVGLPEETARALLDQAGLVARTVSRASDQPAGTVLETDPPAGTDLEPGDEVILVVAERRSTPAPTTAPSGTPSQPVSTG